MRDAPGTYALLLRADTNETLDVGALGEMRISPGIYVYVGSAFGPGGLRARVQRHVRGDGSLHWHVDYLRRVTSVERVWYTHDSARRECTWASVLRVLPASAIPLDGFGASDCTCPSHLVAFDSIPSVSRFRTQIESERADHAPIKQATRAMILQK